MWWYCDNAATMMQPPHQIQITRICGHSSRRAGADPGVARDRRAGVLAFTELTCPDSMIEA
jgi:hypothetical protein